MGFRQILGILRFSDGNTEEWLDTEVDLVGYLAPDERKWPRTSDAARSAVALIDFDVAAGLGADSVATVREHLRLADPAIKGEVAITADEVTFDVFTANTDPTMLASMRVLLAFCAAASCGAEGDLIAAGGRRDTSDYGFDRGLTLRNGQTRSWHPPTDVLESVLRYSGGDLPDLAPDDPKYVD